MTDETLNREALVWIRKKLELPKDAEMFTGQDTIAGRLHVLCHQARGYVAYIEAFKCDDKQGEIARLTVRAEQAEAALAALQQSSEGNDRLRELAREKARDVHMSLAASNEFLTSAGVHVFHGTLKDSFGFNDCPHPDCVLVRPGAAEINNSLIVDGAALPSHDHDAIARRLAAEGTAAFMEDDNRPIENVIYKQVLKALTGAASPQPEGQLSVERAALIVLTRFEESEAAGYRSRERQFAIALLRKAFDTAAALPVPQEPKQADWQPTRKDLLFLLKSTEQLLRAQHIHPHDEFKTCASPQCAEYRRLAESIYGLPPAPTGQSGEQP